MMQMTTGHLIVFLFTLFLFLFPAARILQRVGFNALWSLVLVVPVLGLIGLWLFAFMDWPNLPNTKTAT